MKGFKIKDGDLVISENLLIGKREIEMISGNELTAQTLQSVLSTNAGEWIFDISEGINFANVLGKQKTKSITSTADSALLKEFASQKADTNALAEKLRKRLDGE